MKKILVLGIFLAFLFQSCNDGDIVYENLEFGENQVQKCANKNFYFKTSGNEIIILNIPVDSLMKTNMHLEEFINDQVKVVYRKYSGDVRNNVICDELPPASPSVISELIGQNGGKLIIDKLITSTVNEDRKTASIAYNYTFNFENIKFVDNDVELKFEKLNFGNYLSNTLLLNLNFTTRGEGNDIPKEAYFCPEKNTIVAINSKETILLNLADSFTLPTEEGTQTFLLNEETNAVYKMYKNGALNASDICQFDGNIISTNNNLLENWTAKSGTIEIVTRKTEPKKEDEKPKWHYTISLINAPFFKQIDAINQSETSFQFERFILGSLIGNEVE